MKSGTHNCNNTGNTLPHNKFEGWNKATMIRTRNMINLHFFYFLSFLICKPFPLEKQKLPQILPPHIQNDSNLHLRRAFLESPSNPHTMPLLMSNWTKRRGIQGNTHQCWYCLKKSLMHVLDSRSHLQH